MEQPIVTEAEPILADFDAFTAPEQPQAPQMQVDPQTAQIEQHRPSEVDDMTWEDIKGRVLITSLKINDPITESKLAPESVKIGGVSAVISPGMRAIA